MGRREDLINKVIPLLESGNTLPVVSLEDFFEGNVDRYSIATKLDDAKHPGIPTIYKILKSIRGMAGVQDVFIEVQDTPYPDEPKDAEEWPTSNVLFIVTSAPLEAVQEWVRPLEPNLVHEGWNVEKGVKTPSLETGMRPVRVWWD
jgi:hypothetical protein